MWGFKQTILEEARSSMWISEAYLDTANWFAAEPEAKRAELAARALRELHAEGLIAFQDTENGMSLSDEDVHSLLVGSEW